MRKKRWDFPAVFLFLSVLSAAAPEEWGRLAARKESLYNTIFVYQKDSVVTLRFGRRAAVPIQTQVDLNDLRHHQLEYTKLVYASLLYVPEPNSILVLGLGGGVIPRDFRFYFPQAQIDVVEIDEAIPPLAKEFFAFAEDDKLKVYVDDGRMFIKKRLRRPNPPQYDIIVLDAFNGDYIPFHLMTREFLEEVKGVLSPTGVVAANVFYDNQLFDAEWVTFLKVFDRCDVFLGRTSGNAILISPGAQVQTPQGAAFLERARMLQERHKFAFSLPAIARCFRPDLKPDPQARVLTDDRAPVDYLRQQQRRE
ncbi:MAG: fused MFS/spermidine synthase [Anaerohalosphaeraceae bacterium]